MSANTLLVMPSVVKDRTALHTNIDDKLIYPEIKTIQDMVMMPMLGSQLFTKLQSDIAANTLAGVYKTLLDSYLVDAMCWLVVSEVIGSINYQVWNTGVTSTNADKTSNPSLAEINLLKTKYKQRAEHYMKRARLYLIQNGGLYPEYRNVNGGIDTVFPDKTSYTCPIYLGDENDYPKDSYSRRSNEKTRANILPYPNYNP
jgi:hypothetical protein